MPRTYVKKCQPKYDSEDLREALESVKQGKKTIYAAAKEKNIPYETLRRWTQHTPSHEGSGRGTVLQQSEEKYIVEALQFSARCGFLLDRRDVAEMVKTYVQSKGMKSPFNNDTPGYDFKIWKSCLSQQPIEAKASVLGNKFYLPFIG
ncbi:uncharacterized protein LOC108253433 [Diaphorina citri]|uniref:Uncharacterized protein LOC108253433 n=1 Tax=Diaphorina citri TaxID=121845 RepID=A0A1S4EL62_DIACI|nr:uncharacterized protein LOC108253433 [Diaphorina citri]